MTNPEMNDGSSAESPTPETMSQLEPQLKSYMEHFIKRVFIGSQEKDSILEVEPVLAQALEIIGRNNKINEILYSDEYEAIIQEELELIGDCKLRLGFCVDGRIPRFIFGRSISAWEVPAGVITTEKRRSDDKLIPSSPDLSTGIKELASDGHDLLEVFFAHYDSYATPEHGCAAHALNMDEKALRQNSSIGLDDISALI